jgi:hypothetical protein
MVEELGDILLLHNKNEAISIQRRIVLSTRPLLTSAHPAHPSVHPSKRQGAKIPRYAYWHD